jgi:fatty acid desaturase
LVKHPAEWRQIGIVGAYFALLGAMYTVPACRNVLFLGAACLLSFLNAVVIHNHLHQGIFRSRRLNLVWRCVLSFGSLYPASANVSSHNLVHHRFDDDGQPDWAAPEKVSFHWNFLNLIHFPNVAGPDTFDGVQRRRAVQGRGKAGRDGAFQYRAELAIAFGITGLLALHDPWTTLFFIVIPQLYGARGILRVNLIQHDGCDRQSTWNHSRNFVGRAFNWIMCNNGFHTIHHHRAGLHWSVLAGEHERQVVPRVDPALDEPSMVLYLLRTYLLRFQRPDGSRPSVAPARAVPPEARPC